MTTSNNQALALIGYKFKTFLHPFSFQRALTSKLTSIKLYCVVQHYSFHLHQSNSSGPTLSSKILAVYIILSSLMH
jgi:hypothetical protein